MKNIISSLLLILVLGLFFAFRPAEAPEEDKSIKWYTFEEALELNQKNPKKMFIDVYTDWCGWCKKMDKFTFTDPAVAAYLNENYYPVKFNAEQKESVDFKGYTLKYLPDAGRRGVHELAYALLDGRMGYPAFVYLDKNQDRITISPGYKEADAMLTELQFIGEEHYNSMSFEEFKGQKQP
jgi:thioredoxin-related protein